MGSIVTLIFHNFFSVFFGKILIFIELFILYWFHSVGKAVSTIWFLYLWLQWQDLVSWPEESDPLEFQRNLLFPGQLVACAQMFGFFFCLNWSYFFFFIFFWLLLLFYTFACSEKISWGYLCRLNGRNVLKSLTLKPQCCCILDNQFFEIPINPLHIFIFLASLQMHKILLTWPQLCTHINI